MPEIAMTFPLVPGQTTHVQLPEDVSDTAWIAKMVFPLLINFGRTIHIVTQDDETRDLIGESLYDVVRLELSHQIVNIVRYKDWIFPTNRGVLKVYKLDKTPIARVTPDVIVAVGLSRFLPEQKETLGILMRTANLFSISHS